MGTSDSAHDREEVFYTIPLQGRRRHSVGGYLATGAAGHGEITTVPSEVPKMPPPKFGQKEDETVKRRRPKNFPFKGKFRSKIMFYRIYVWHTSLSSFCMLSVMWSVLTQDRYNPDFVFIHFIYVYSAYIYLANTFDHAIIFQIK